MATMDSNTGGGKFFDISIMVEEDDGVFLGLVVRDGESYREIVDAVTTSPGEIDQFFEEVARAKADWDRMKQ